MFYSQFILAKKGPLGTIWIAAHLERKLRKNQVADTDIGVSVEFLNADDETDSVEEEDNVPGAEEGPLFDNSGWSSRTRAVAKYLKSLFDNEAGHGRKVVPVDNLLAGKTRKEVSRMFFETLVLKTKDYIHVEQQNAFKKINIQPRIKLMKSEF